MNEVQQNLDPELERRIQNRLHNGSSGMPRMRVDKDKIVLGSPLRMMQTPPGKECIGLDDDGNECYLEGKVLEARGLEEPQWQVPVFIRDDARLEAAEALVRTAGLQQSDEITTVQRSSAAKFVAHAARRLREKYAADLQLIVSQINSCSWALQVEAMDRNQQSQRHYMNFFDIGELGQELKYSAQLDSVIDALDGDIEDLQELQEAMRRDTEGCLCRPAMHGIVSERPPRRETYRRWPFYSQR